MSKHNIATIILVLFFQATLTKTYAQFTNPAPGVQKISTGQPDKFTPYSFCEELPITSALGALPAGKLPFNINDIKISINDRE